MDAYDLFKKLGAGAKFNFQRFRDDAERLHLVKPKRNDSQTVSVKPPVGKIESPFNTDKESDAVAREQDEVPSDADQDKSSSDSEADQQSSESEGSDTESNESSSESESSQSFSESDSSSGQAFNDLEEEESELRLLGNMKAAKDDMENTKAALRKKRKKQRKKASSAEKLAELKQEQINHIRNVHHVHAHGTDIPDPVETFDQLVSEYKIHPRVIQNITTVGYTTPTPIQIQAVPVMLHRRDIMACAPTGSGKTAAFIVPILHHLREPRNEGVRALVLAPTRELAKQTYREFQRLSDGINFKIMYIDKIGKDPKRLIQVAKKIDILVSTPNRLVYMLRQEPPLVSLSGVQWLVVDESDKLFEEGKTGFRDQLGTIYKACDGHNLRRAMFSATFTFEVEEWCKLNLDNVIQVYIGARNSATQTIEQSLLFCGAETGKLLAMRDIIRKGIQPPVLVFVQSKDRAKDLFHELLYDGLNVDVIHAERTQLQRDNVVKSFRAGKIWILICTELMGRGIDFKGVNLVINYDFPNSAISYIHRIGRTGRAGRTGKAITFFTEDDSVYLRSIANVMKAAGCPVPDYMLKINKPDRQEQRRLAKGSIKRKRISTVTNYDIQKAKKKRLMVDEGKKKKLRDQGLLPETASFMKREDSAKKMTRKITDGGKENVNGKKRKLSTNETNSPDSSKPFQSSKSSKAFKKTSFKHKDFKSNFQNKMKRKSGDRTKGYTAGRKDKQFGQKLKKKGNKPWAQT